MGHCVNTFIQIIYPTSLFSLYRNVRIDQCWKLFDLFVYRVALFLIKLINKDILKCTDVSNKVDNSAV